MGFSSRTLHGVTALLLAALACTASGRAAGRKPSSLCRESASAKASPLSVDRIFSGKEFDEERLRLFHWSNRTSDYFTLDGPAGGGKARNLVRNDPATGKKQVVVPAEALIPPGGTVPLTVDDFEFSADESKVLIYTNSKRVWRQNTRGDYWFIDLGTRRLQKLGGDAAASTLMFARFSPDGTRVAYVHENNLYVQQLRNMRITALTTDGSESIVNGTADWANEEELDIRDGFRWSPDGREIVFWQFDTTGVRRFHILKGAENGYPQVLSFPYPKVGETNSATRLGVVAQRAAQSAGSTSRVTRVIIIFRMRSGRPTAPRSCSNSSIASRTRIA